MKFQSQFPSQSIHPLTFIYTTKKLNSFLQPDICFTIRSDSFNYQPSPMFRQFRWQLFNAVICNFQTTKAIDYSLQKSPAPVEK